MSKIETILPDYYASSKYTLALCAVGNAEFARLRERIKKYKNNISIMTADADGLRVFENDFCIRPSGSDTEEVRKNRIAAKKRGVQDMTKDNFTSLIQLYDETAYIVQNPKNYSFKICLSRYEMLSEIMSVAEDYKPAHLGVEYDIIVSAKTVPNVFSGGKIVQIKTVLPSAVASSQRTYADLKNKYSEFGDIKEKTYAELMYEEEKYE